MGELMAPRNCAKCGKTLSPEQAGSPCPNCGSLDRKFCADDQAIAAEKAEVAKELARKHYQVEVGLKHVLRFSGPDQVEVMPAEPIKLLEVNEHTVPSGVMPLYFGPAPASGIPYPSVIIEVTPEEYEQIRRQEIKLPKGWETAVELPKPPDVGVGT
jgi:hypothetical protein